MIFNSLSSSVSNSTHEDPCFFNFITFYLALTSGTIKDSIPNSFSYRKTKSVQIASRLSRAYSGYVFVLRALHI